MSSSDSKKEEFRKYLERSGVIDNLTKVLIALYEEPEKPANAIEFVRRFLTTPSGIDVDALVAENEELKKRVEELSMEVERLQQMQQAQEISNGE
ncbi:putative C-Myc-binding protein [Monocercomonoides exilis]|uniref:putative C-Myc-binding protein n=1 Tax=Monocercomonoides exilis TaxID=2049356 RepID=UPI003559E57F|nr:putative C-Myc-binding protein [Monocercomonoides exilis]|eukprot:MONOS_6644.1-p1 / transcript=MONOS_6644.1 / gene=MONOS_6644 / organism=Monocercomonoides_exilis_PA203 / gene_product=C-Myc-binding protein, putative / transcript_product=C-Myc-binding protein, putative / location=Mono_scaffold00213:9691-10288(+) / protein_length=94 / sequence_SO=supercontig / SO=protein_coding / is_pseudo=false